MEGGGEAWESGKFGNQRLVNGDSPFQHLHTLECQPKAQVW